jgi:hypothetical protein
MRRQSASAAKGKLPGFDMRKITIQIAAIITAAFLFADSLLLLAGDFKRFEIQPFGGFTASGSIPLESSDNTQLGSIHVESSAHVGMTLTVYLNESDSVEGLWQRQNSRGQLPAEFVAPLAQLADRSFDLRIDRIHCNFLHQYAVENSKAFPYVMGGLGATTYHGFSAAGDDSMTRFSFALGGGIKYFFTRSFGLRLEARWVPTILSASDSQFWCSVGGAGAQCVINLKGTVHNQVDFTGGIIFRF